MVELQKFENKPLSTDNEIQFARWMQNTQEKVDENKIRKWINKFYQDKDSINIEDIYLFCINNNILYPIIKNYLIKNKIAIKLKNNNIENIEHIITNSNNNIKEYVKDIDDNTYNFVVFLYYLRLQNWVATLPYKIPTHYDITNFLQSEPDNIVNNEDQLNLMLKKLYINPPNKLEGLIFIRKPENKWSSIDNFYVKYFVYYNLIGSRPSNISDNILKTHNIIQKGGSGLDCNNTKVLYNSLGSCWNNAVQSVYAFYLGEFNKTIIKTGENLYKTAKENGLIYYLPEIFYDNEDILIKLLDSITTRWRIKFNNSTNFEFTLDDHECEIQTMSLFMGQLLNNSSLSTMSSDDLYNNVNGHIEHLFFMSLIFNVFFCNEIYDFHYYDIYNINSIIPDEDYEIYNKHIISNTEYNANRVISNIFNYNDVKEDAKNDNLVGIILWLNKHTTSIVKCNDSKYGHFNNYYDDNYKKIYTLDYKEFINIIINSLNINSNIMNINYHVDIIKPKGQKVQIVITNLDNGTILNITNIIKNKYIKYKLKYLKLQKKI
jgi:hypothetical protein